MRKTLAMVLGLVLACATLALAENGPDSNDKSFVKQAAIGNAAEIQLAQMAQGKASNQEVKDFAGRMMKDHSKADDKLKGIAATEHIPLPTALDAPHKTQKSTLSTLSGGKFDKEYMLMMVQDHEKTVHKFQAEAQSGHDPTIKNFAVTTLPILKSHLEEAKKVQSDLQNQQAK